MCLHYLPRQVGTHEQFANSYLAKPSHGVVLGAGNAAELDLVGCVGVGTVFVFLCRALRRRRPRARLRGRGRGRLPREPREVRPRPRQDQETGDRFVS